MRAVVALAAVGLLGGCAAPDNPGRRQEAADVAREYLLAVSGQATDRGWSLLYRSAREAWGTEDEYVATMAAEDWSRFHVGALETIRCDDGLICQVALDILNGRESVPLPLRSTDNRRTDGILFREVENLPGNAELWVINSDLLNGEGGVLVGAMFTR
jgi:hypothetical protein